jgi:hypothetical protein
MRRVGSPMVQPGAYKLTSVMVLTWNWLCERHFHW